MGSGAAARSMSVMLFALPILIQVVADSPDDVVKEDTDELEELYYLDDAYDTLMESDDLLEDFGYATDSLEEYAGYGEDSLFYYSDEFDEYYNTYGIYADEYGYDYFDSDSSSETDCKLDDKGKASTEEDVCDVKLSGVDAHLTKDIAGGIDGLYKVDGCFEGLPKYKRTGNTANDTRVLWKSTVFNDWDISLGEEVNMAQAVLYGLGSGLETRPNFLEESHWRLVPNVAQGTPDEGDEYVKVNVTVKCDGKKQLSEPETKKSTQSLLTEDEADANYRAVYTRYKRDPDPSINFFMVVLMAALGAGVVIGIPRLMKRKQDSGKTLAQVIEDARKQRQGHTL